MGIDFDSIPVVTPDSEAYSEKALQVVTEVPMWVLKNILAPGGVRQEARPKHNWKETEINPQCGVCLWGVPFVNRAIVNGITYHLDCWIKKQKSGGYQPDATIVIPSDGDWTNTSGVDSPAKSSKDMELKGNLGDAEYHLWVGSRLVDSDFAMCRACRFVTHGAAQRTLHKLDTTRHIAGQPCWRVISEICKVASMKNRCMVCKENCALTRWGVHLCSWRCANDWKFNQEVRHLDFMMALSNIRSAALEKERAEHNAQPQFD